MPGCSRLCTSGAVDAVSLNVRDILGRQPVLAVLDENACMEKEEKPTSSREFIRSEHLMRL